MLEDEKSKSKSSSKPKEHNEHWAKPDENSKALAISINKEIVELGKDGQWRDILNLYQCCIYIPATVLSILKSVSL
jgi:hypothetical protein